MRDGRRAEDGRLRDQITATVAASDRERGGATAGRWLVEMLSEWQIRGGAEREERQSGQTRTHTERRKIRRNDRNQGEEEEERQREAGGGGGW